MNTSLKASCQYDLSFPYHHEETAIERLTAIQSYMQTQQFDNELLGDGQAISKLEEKVAALLGKPAAMWCPTGTMAQAIAARIHASKQNSNRLLLHPTSHLLLHESDSYKLAHGLNAKTIGQWQQPITASMLEAGAACAFIELPQRHNGGLLPTWDELSTLKLKAAELQLPLHMDGARLWSCLSHYETRSFAEISDGFDSIYVSLYKDIGALGGALLIGQSDFIDEARIWRHRLGGLLIQPWPLINDALRLLDKRLEQMPTFITRAKQLSVLLTPLVSIKVQPQIPHTNMLHIHLPCSAKVAEAARDDVARTTGAWLSNRFWSYENNDKCALELIVGEKALEIPDSTFLTAVSTLVHSI